MTAMLALMLGALGLGQALNDLGDFLHPYLPTFDKPFIPASIPVLLPSFLVTGSTLIHSSSLYPTPLYLFLDL